jgi:hypothetical protein
VGGGGESIRASLQTSHAPRTAGDPAAALVDRLDEVRGVAGGAGAAAGNGGGASTGDGLVIDFVWSVSQPDRPAFFRGSQGAADPPVDPASEEPLE